MRYTPSRRALGLVAASAVLLAGTVAVTPAGAVVEDRAADGWGKIWKKKLQPKADKRYWTKTKADARYAGKTSAYTKPESDAKYYSKTDADAKYYSKTDADAKYYSKTESDGKYYSKTDADAKYQVKQKTYRGTYLVGAPSTAAGAFFFGDLTYGVTLAAAPTAHYIQTGAAVPAGCSGTPAAPSADPGHLCVFESQAFNVGPTRFVTNLAFGSDTATPTGAWLYGTTVGVSYGFFGGSWAMQPGGAATVSNLKGASPDFGPTEGMPRIR